MVRRTQPSRFVSAAWMLLLLTTLSSSDHRHRCVHVAYAFSFSHAVRVVPSISQTPATWSAGNCGLQTRAYYNNANVQSANNVAASCKDSTSTIMTTGTIQLTCDYKNSTTQLKTACVNLGGKLYEAVLLASGTYTDTATFLDVQVDFTFSNFGTCLGKACSNDNVTAFFYEVISAIANGIASNGFSNVTAQLFTVELVAEGPTSSAGSNNSPRNFLALLALSFVAAVTAKMIVEMV